MLTIVEDINPATKAYQFDTTSALNLIKYTIESNNATLASLAPANTAYSLDISKINGTCNFFIWLNKNYKLIYYFHKNNFIAETTFETSKSIKITISPCLILISLILSYNN